MPSIPKYDSPQVAPQALPGARLSGGASPQAFGGGIGQGLQQAAQTLDDVYQDEKRKANKAALLAAERKLGEWENSALFDPEKGALSKRGEDALGVEGPALQDFDRLAGELESGVVDEDARLDLRARINSRRVDIGRTLARHTGSERDNLYEKETDAFLANSLQAAGNHYNDEVRIGQELTRGTDAIMERADRLGWTAPITQAALAEYESKLHGGVLDRMLAGEQYGAARAYFEANKDGLDPKEQARVEKAVREGSTRGAAQAATARIMAEYGGDMKAALAAARKIGDPEVQDSVVSRVMDLFQERKMLEDETDRQNLDAAQEIITREKSTDKIPPAMWASFDVATQAKLKEAAAYARSGTPAQDDAKWYDFARRWESMTPADQAKVNLYTEIRPYVDDTRFDGFVKEQRAAMEHVRTGGKAAEYVAGQDFKGRLLTGLQKGGIVPAGKGFGELKDAEGERAVRVLDEATRRLDTFQATKGGKATPAEQQSIVDEILIQKVFVDEWGSDPERLGVELSDDDRADAYVPLAKIPAAELASMRNLAQSKGRPVTDDKLRRAYAAYILRDRARFDAILAE